MIKDETLIWFIGFLLVLIIWQITSVVLNSTSLPTPILIFDSIFNNIHIHYSNLLQTSLESFTGLILSIVITSLIIFSIGVFPKVEILIYPFILLIKSTPAVAFVPIFILLVGTGVITKILVASMICFFPLVIGGIDGLGRTPERFEILSNTYGGNDYKAFIYLKIGYTVNGFCSGLKTAAPLSVIGAIVGEYVTGGNQAGLGAFIITNVVKSVKINLYAGAVLSTFLGLLFFFISNIIYNVYDKYLHLGK